MHGRDRALVLLVAVLWGFNFVVIHWGMAGVPPLLFLAIRYAAVLFPAILFVPRPEVAWSVLIRIGALMALGQFAFLYLALDAGMPPGLAALVLQAQAVFAVLIAAVVLHERPRPRQIAALAVAVLGLVVVGLGRDGRFTTLGLVFSLAAALSWGAGSVVTRRAGIKGGLGVTVWSGLVVPIPALLLALAINGWPTVAASLQSFSRTAVLSTLYTALVSTVLCYGIFNTLLARHKVADVVSWILLVPVFAAASAWIFLGERPAPTEIIGGVLLVAGVLGAVRAAAGTAPAPTVQTAVATEVP